MAGLLDFLNNQSPEQRQGLLAAAAQILQQSGPSRTPTSLGQILGGGISAYQQTEQQARQQGQLEQMRALRTRALQADLTKDERALADQQRLIDFYSKRGAQDGVAPPLDAGVQTPPIGSMGRPTGALTTGTNATQTWFEKQMAEADELERAGLVPRADAIRKQAIAFRGKAKWDTVKQGDTVRNMPFYEDGTTGAAADAEIAEKLNFQDINNKIVGLDPFSGAVAASHNKGVDPDTAARIAAQRERSSFEQRQSGRPVYDRERGVLVDPLTGVASPVRNADGTEFGPKPKDIPGPMQKTIMENDAALRKVDDALAAIEAYPDALGAWNYLGDSVRQRSDPEGVSARALVADIGSLKIHDRSGAAVTAAETPRLKPFIPAATDNPETVKTKLGLFRKEYEAIQNDVRSTYSKEQGYRELPKQVAAPAANIPRDAINHLKLNPKLRDAFDAKYGAGAAASVLGR